MLRWHASAANTGCCREDVKQHPKLDPLRHKELDADFTRFAPTTLRRSPNGGCWCSARCAVTAFPGGHASPVITRRRAPSVGSRLQRPVECGDRLGETVQRLLASAGESVGAAADAVEPAVDVAL